MKNNNKKGGMSAGKVMAIGASVAALAAASYYFFGPEGKKNQKKMKGWMIKMKGEIVDKMENAKEMSEMAYHKIVDTAATAFSKHTSASAEDVAAYATLLKKQWKGITGALKKTPAKKSAPKKAAPKKSPTKKK